MTSDAKVEANRRNALKSTGPRTPAGKVLAQYNAVRHGVLTAAPLVPGEDAGAWEGHRRGVVDSLAPAGGLEAALADRVALTLWRLGRVARAEALATAADVADAVLAKVPTDPDYPPPDPFGAAIAAARSRESAARERLAPARAAARALAGFADLPDDAPVSAELAEEVLAAGRGALRGRTLTAKPPSVGGARLLALLELGDPPAWTAGAVRRGLGVFAACVGGGTADGLFAATARDARGVLRARAAKYRACRAARVELQERRRTAPARRAAAAALIPAARADLVVRYEGHLQKVLTTTLHELERLQAARAGRAVPPAVAVDVTVTGGIE